MVKLYDKKKKVFRFQDIMDEIYVEFEIITEEGLDAIVHTGLNFLKEELAQGEEFFFNSPNANGDEVGNKGITKFYRPMPLDDFPLYLWRRDKKREERRLKKELEVKNDGKKSKSK